MMPDGAPVGYTIYCTTVCPGGSAADSASKVLLERISFIISMTAPDSERFDR